MSVLARLLGDAPGRVHGVAIEPMRRRHLGPVLAIEQVAYPRPWTKGVFESELEQVRVGLRHYVVGRRDRRIVGYAGLWITPDPAGDQAHVTNVAVAADERRTGVATALLVALARHAIERGCVAWTLEVRASSTGAQELYRRFGFAPAGIRRNYYEGREDAIVMWCHDLATPEYAARLEELACRT